MAFQQEVPLLMMDFQKEVEQKAAASGAPYKMVTHFLSDEETSQIRIATDIVLNAQLTDGFSASIQEHIFAGNVVVVGDWLQYKSLDNSDVFYKKSPEQGFAATLSDVIENYEHYQQLANGNADKIYNLSSWKSRLPYWIQIYGGRLKKEVSNIV